jgi:hypothetical protein
MSQKISRNVPFSKNSLCPDTPPPRTKARHPLAPVAKQTHSALRTLNAPAHQGAPSPREICKTKPRVILSHPPKPAQTRHNLPKPATARARSAQVEKQSHLPFWQFPRAFAPFNRRISPGAQQTHLAVLTLEVYYRYQPLR